MEYVVFWFRRDLRLEDNAGLYHALQSGFPVIPIFIFDSNILNFLESKDDPRVSFIYETILELKLQLRSFGSDLLVFYDTPKHAWEKLFSDYRIRSIFSNRDYEPYAIQRDLEIRQLAQVKQIDFFQYKDQVIFEQQEVCKDDQTSYTVFTPYKKKWLQKLMEHDHTIDTSFYFKSYPVEKKLDSLWKTSPIECFELKDLGFVPSSIPIPSKKIVRQRIRDYTQNRDFPFLLGTSRLGIHFRFGTISIREKARLASVLNATFLSELIWRDFYSMILQSFPRVVHESFKPAYDRIQWRNVTSEFTAWCEGKTGFPIVDAGMRELNATGFMHNRVRMVVASFLVKDLLVDWRWGEAYFASKLLDFDLASNNGGWQWAAGCGTDAAPYFRIFSPDAQQKKFDPQFKYIKKWISEFGTPEYPLPIVDHKIARARCLEVFKKALNE
ncbi:MAG: deoxyribodipyrimidine photo-lyase [Saprospiraceae bacterium]|nr:deoxyribodipyrimidine photo-lyase [Candidatus Defluviibacterium haderslevense]